MDLIGEIWKFMKELDKFFIYGIIIIPLTLLEKIRYDYNIS